MTPASAAVERSSHAARTTGFAQLLSFPAALAALLATLAVLTVRTRFADPDMWWHLKYGQVIAATHHIPTTDLFSYTTNHHSVVVHEWLSELLIYAAYAAHGYSGLMLWECAFTAAILLAGYYLCTLYAGNPKLGFLGAIVIWFFGTIGFSVRPQMVGYLLLIAEFVILHLGRTRHHRWFWLLPPLFALWINCHGSFLLGMVVAAAYLAAGLVPRGIGAILPTQFNEASRRSLAIAIAVSVPALLLNPAGMKLILYPVQAILVPSIGVAAVSEWQPLAFTEIRAFVFLAIVLLLLILPAVSHARLFVHELVLVGLATYAATSHRRLLFAFGILVAPVVARMLADVWSNDRNQQEHPIANAVVITGALLVACAAFPSRASLESQVRSFSPVGAVEYIRSHQLSGPMLNDWVDGGYLLWAMPEHPVFIDGRGDIYEWSGVMAAFGRWATLTDPPNLLLDRYQIHFCLLRRDSQMVNAMALLSGWQRVYTDSVSVIFVRTG